MAYINCNGQIRSRGSSDPEVKKCMADAKIASTESYQVCMADPVCKADHEFKTDMTIGIIGVTVMVLFILLIGIGKQIAKINNVH